jgi:uncharacterized protein (DUF608 family)
MVLAAVLVLAAESAPAQGPPGSPHLVPADKNLARGWVQGMYARGAKDVFRGNELNAIGMPVGGIGTGQLYLCGEGALGCWEIFNRHEFRGTGDTSYNPRIPERAVDQGFAVVVQSGAQRVTRTLNRHGFAEVSFNGQYPVGTILYREDGFPVEVELQAFSPFIPLNAKDSALPVTVFHITVKNASPDPVNTGILAWLENAVCRYTASELPGLRRTRIINDKGRTFIVHMAEEAPKPANEPAERPLVVVQDFEGETYGDWQAAGEALGTGPAHEALTVQQEVRGFEGTGFVNTFHGGDDTQGTLTSPPFTISRKFINLLVGGGNYPGETCVNLLVDGAVARTTTGKNTEQLAWITWKVDDLEGKPAQIQIVDKKTGGWGHINVDHIELSDAHREGPAGPITDQGDFGTLALAFAEESGDPQTAAEIFNTLEGPRNKVLVTGNDPYPFPERRNAALLSTRSDVAPGAQRVFTFVLAWHFPNAPKGHEYAARFADAPAVAHYVFDNHDRLTTDTLTWRDTYYDSTLPYWLLDRLHSTASYLATGTCQWWQNGRFYAYEGVVCCHGTCTHVWNYEHALARLFPELSRSTREMQDFNPDSGGAFHPDTGLVGFRSDNNYAADGQCGSILKAYREHQMSANAEFLARNWPKIKKALEYLIQQDGNDDGLIENTQPNTYDINFEGPNTFVGSLYLAALRAGEEMAREMGDIEFADRCRRIFDSGSRLSVERLWNGEYFIQVVDLNKFPKDQYGPGCLSDQLFGQGWARQVGLGAIYPEPNVKQALGSVWKYNWAPDIGPYNQAHKPLRWFISPGEAGLLTCTWPKSAYLDQGVIYKDEVWTGIEYQVAGNLIWEGMIEEGLAMCRAVHDRYHPLKRNPYNEVECGDHYARAMASWGVFTALAGYEHHGPKGHLGFAPRITPENFKAAFTAAEGWGAFSQRREGNAQHERIEVRWGKLRLKTLAFSLPANVPGATVSVTVGGNPVPATSAVTNGRLVITLTNEAMINVGEAVDVSIT